MKKIYCVVLAVLCILPCLAGCGKVNAANEEPLIRSFVIGNSTAEIQTHTEDIMAIMTSSALTWWELSCTLWPPIRMMLLMVHR